MCTLQRKILHRVKEMHTEFSRYLHFLWICIKLGISQETFQIEINKSWQYLHSKSFSEIEHMHLFYNSME